VAQIGILQSASSLHFCWPGGYSMKLLRGWPTLRTTLIAVALFVSAVGMGQFAFTEWSEPCLRVPSPYERLCEWLREGRRGPVSHVLGPQELKRLAGHSLSISILGLMLVISIRAQRPLRLRLHLRTLMVFVAVLPLGYLGGREVWLTWERWDEYQHRIQRCLNMEEWARRKNPSATPELAAIERQAAPEYRLERERLQRAMWSPRFWFTLVSRTPQL
jgi:hypothetical protein